MLSQSEDSSAAVESSMCGCWETSHMIAGSMDILDMHTSCYRYTNLLGK
jgi:hypothetical protein